MEPSRRQFSVRHPSILSCQRERMLYSTAAPKCSQPLRPPGGNFSIDMLQFCLAKEDKFFPNNNENQTTLYGIKQFVTSGSPSTRRNTDLRLDNISVSPMSAASSIHIVHDEPSPPNQGTLRICPPSHTLYLRRFGLNPVIGHYRLSR